MEANVVMTQFTSAAVFVWGMQRLKDASWFPLLKHEGQVWQKRLASIGTALGVHLGISHVWNPGAQPGTHVLIITVPAVSVIAVGAWHWLGQYAMQETMYQATVNKLTTTSDATGAIPLKVNAEGAVVVPAAKP
jgi:hypothetical protein